MSRIKIEATMKNELGKVISKRTQKGSILGPTMRSLTDGLIEDMGWVPVQGPDSWGSIDIKVTKTTRV